MTSSHFCSLRVLRKSFPKTSNEQWHIRQFILSLKPIYEMGQMQCKEEIDFAVLGA